MEGPGILTREFSHKSTPVGARKVCFYKVKNSVLCFTLVYVRISHYIRMSEIVNFILYSNEKIEINFISLNFKVL